MGKKQAAKAGGKAGSAKPGMRAGMRAGGASEALIRARIDQAQQDWQRRHPDQARAERALRKRRAVMLEAWTHKANGTPETHAHAAIVQQGALARLYQSCAIDAEQLAWAGEIAAVAEAIGRDVAVKTASLETRIDAGGRIGGAFHEALGSVRREMAYSAWRRSLDHPALILDMIVGDTGCAAAAARHGMHHRRARRLLIEAINAWPAYWGDAWRRVDEGDLDRAHARLAM